jgi:ABC-type Fe3+ transport system permease subunit
LSSSIFLFVPGTETTALRLREMRQEANFSPAAILSRTLIGIPLLVVIPARFLSGCTCLKSTR